MSNTVRTRTLQRAKEACDKTYSAFLLANNKFCSLHDKPNEAEKAYDEFIAAIKAFENAYDNYTKLQDNSTASQK